MRCSTASALLAVWLLLGCQPASAVVTDTPKPVLPTDKSPTPLRTVVLPAQPERNFAFLFAFGTCGIDVLDLFEGTYTRQIDREEYVTISISLTDAQKETIFQKMAEIDFFSYPETFAIPVREGETYKQITPAPSYRLTVRNGERTKTVTWEDEIVEPTTPEADRLRELIRIILRIVQTHPDIEKLPESRLMCV